MSAAGRAITDGTIHVRWRETLLGRFGQLPRTRLQPAHLRHLAMPSGWSRDACWSARSSSRIPFNAEDQDLFAGNRHIGLIDVRDPTESAYYSAGCEFFCGILPGNSVLRFSQRAAFFSNVWHACSTSQLSRSTSWYGYANKRALFCNSSSGHCSSSSRLPSSWTRVEPSPNSSVMLVPNQEAN